VRVINWWEWRPSLRLYISNLPEPILGDLVFLIFVRVLVPISFSTSSFGFSSAARFLLGILFAVGPAFFFLFLRNMWLVETKICLSRLRSYS
jgi:hypothetical protein